MEHQLSDKIRNPCIRNCCLNEEDICLGCFRSLHEITDWHQQDRAGRQRILRNAENRRRTHK